MAASHSSLPSKSWSASLWSFHTNSQMNFRSCVGRPDPASRRQLLSTCWIWPTRTNIGVQSRSRPDEAQRELQETAEGGGVQWLAAHIEGGVQWRTTGRRSMNSQHMQTLWRGNCGGPWVQPFGGQSMYATAQPAQAAIAACTGCEAVPDEATCTAPRLAVPKFPQVGQA